MLSAALKREVEITLETALMLAESGVSIAKIAERVYDSEPALVDQLKRPLILERFVWLLNRRRQHTPSQKQMLLPGFPTLPQRITLKNGKRPFLMEANLSHLKQFREVLLKRKGARLVIIEKLIEFMAPYAAQTPGITVARVVAAQKGDLLS